MSASLSWKTIMSFVSAWLLNKSNRNLKKQIYEMGCHLTKLEIGTIDIVNSIRSKNKTNSQAISFRFC